jgi:outer membrane protein assembly factor BamD
MKRTLALCLLTLLAALAVSSLSGCGGGIQDDPILKLSGEEALSEGKRLIEEKKYSRARRYLTHAFEVEPNSRSGREALLLVADTYYLQGGLTNFIQAESKYRDFLNRFPTSNQAGYAQFQAANSLIKRMEKPDRDQSTTQKALEAFQEVIRLYPTSEYAEEAREQIKIVQQNLAEHELIVGRFNYRFGNYAGAVSRLEYLLETYPDFTGQDEALYILGLSYRKSRSSADKLKALAAFHRLENEHPDSPLVRKIPDLEALEKAAEEGETQEAKDGEAEDGGAEDGGAEDGGAAKPVSSSGDADSGGERR